MNKNVRIGYLPQEAGFKSGRTVLKEMLEGDDTIRALKREKERLEETGQAADMRYGEVLHQLEALGFYDLEFRAKKILAGLGFKQSDFDRPIKELSGGWQMRTLLARLLTCHYDVLLLDEPTNYLDLNAALWLKDYLASFKGAFVMISHDRDYLDEVANYTLVLEHGLISKVKGNYEHYLKIREERHSHLLKKFNEQQKKKEQLQAFISRFHAQPNKASQVRAKKKMLERMEEVTVPVDLRESIRSFHFPETKESGYQVMMLEKLSKNYANIQVYRDLDFEIIKGEKAVFVGENGAGKSTLLKVMAGVIDFDSGSRKTGHNVSIGYFSQTRMDVLNEHNTVFEEAYSASEGSLAGESIRTILGAFLFTGDDVEKSVKILSGGEKSRLILAKLLINPPNFLLLDEPTTHLDVDAVEALIKALKEYKGTLAFISHDIHFVRSVANMVYEVDKGKVRKIHGNFDYYRERKARGDLAGDDPRLSKPVKQSALPAKERRKLEAQKRKELAAKRKAHNDKLSQRIKKLRKEKERLEVKGYAKQRVVERRSGRGDEHIVKEYAAELEKIKKKISRVEENIEKLKSQFI